MPTMQSKVMACVVLCLGAFGAVAACGSDDADQASGARPDGGAPGQTSGGVDLDGGTRSPDFDANTPVVTDGKCGYQNTGTPLHVADGIDLCLPKTTCAAETCPPPLGDCVDGVCKFKPGYDGLLTLPEAWATQYCKLSSGGCHGVTQIDFAEVTASSIAKNLGLPICDADATGPNCVGIAASSPMVVGNSQVTKDPATGQPVKAWGAGLTEASGLCYELEGPGGKVTVALTDRCGGYCKCGGSDFQECGPCVDAKDMAPNCPCVGTSPSLYTSCCGNNCGVPVEQRCDWCANNNHPHFDLDDASFFKLCGSSSSAGSCKIAKVKPVACLPPKAWPPGGGGGCGASSFHCDAPADQQPMVPGTQCCCNYGLKPQPDGSCK
ncbi:MAG: hypothetical protein U0270_04310 [Labilithrix sp.]